MVIAVLVGSPFANPNHQLYVPENVSHGPSSVRALLKQEAVLETAKTDHAFDLAQIPVFVLELRLELLVGGGESLPLVYHVGRGQEEELGHAEMDDPLVVQEGKKVFGFLVEKEQLGVRLAGGAEVVV